MQGNEHMTMNRAENHARSAIIPSTMSLQTTVSQERGKGINKTPQCFSCPGDCKELSKQTKRSTYDSNQARNQAMAGPTADLRQQLADHEADKDK